jgi:probable rRNA maturation factor
MKKASGFRHQATGRNARVTVRVSREGTDHPVRPIQQDARTLLRALGLAPAELSILLCDDPRIRELNRDWRGKDEPTDVLSFAMGEGDDADLHPEILGDIVISVDTAAREGTPMRVLLVHGLCHLLGYDHIEEADAVEMRAKEAHLLAALGESPDGLVARAGCGERSAVSDQRSAEDPEAPLLSPADR